jgi:hypothetical protein
VSADAISCLKEIQRVSKGKRVIALAAYETEEDKRLFEWWTLLGTTLLKKDEWVEVLNHVGYTGDYKFTTAQSLNLIIIHDKTNLFGFHRDESTTLHNPRRLLSALVC